MRGSARFAFAALVLIALWIVVYWRTNAGPANLDAAEPEVIEPAASTSPPLAAALDKAPAFVAPAPSPAPVVSVPEPVFEPVAAPKSEPSSIVVPEKAAAPAPGTVIPPEFDLYEIKRGDTAATISTKKYGTSKYWRQVLKANPFQDFDKLKPGQVVKVPHDPKNVQGVTVEQTAKDVETVEYVVGEGDTLMAIASTLYGKGMLWELIRDANRDQINEAGTNIRPGMTLKIPPPPEGVGAHAPKLRGS